MVAQGFSKVSDGLKLFSMVLNVLSYFVSFFPKLVYLEDNYSISSRPGVAGGPAGFPRALPSGSPSFRIPVPKPQLPTPKFQAKDPKLKYFKFPS